MSYDMYHKRYSVVVICFFIFFFVSLPAFANNVPDQNHSSLNVSSSVPADGKTSAIITITLHDSAGNPIIGDSVTLSDSSNSGAIITTMSNTTDGSGHAIFSITSTKIQTDNLNVADTTANVTFYNLGTITFTTVGCYDSPPGSTPYLTSAIATAPNTILLTWTDAANPVTHYLLSYGLISGQYIYGNPNVGGQGITSYSVGSLSSGKKYYFVVQAVNGCTPGNFSNEVSITAQTPTPTSDINSKINSQDNISPTVQKIITPIDTPVVLQDIQRTTSPTPTQASTTNGSINIVLFLSLCIVGVGSIGNILYWKHKKNEIASMKIDEDV